MATILADLVNCYDRIHHAIMALVFLSLCVGIGPIAAMLGSIQMMNFYLRTVWGESSQDIGDKVSRILHRFCQGNAAAPAR